MIPGVESYVDGLLLYEAAANSVVTVVVGTALLGFFPDWGLDMIRTARRSRIVSFGFGILATLTILVAVGSLVVLTVTFFLSIVLLVPVAIFAVTYTVVWTTAGFLAASAYLWSLLGIEHPAAWVLGAGILVFGLSIVPVIGPVVFLLIGITGMGAGVRVTRGAGGVSGDERVIAPSSKT